MSNRVRSRPAVAMGSVSFVAACSLLLSPLSAGAHLRRPGSVQGTVEAGGQPVANARVTLFTPSLAFFREDRTDGAGDYAFAGVPDGQYRLGVASLNRAYAETAVAIAGGALQRDVALLPETEPGRWDVIGNTLPEFFDATDIAIMLPDGRIMYCHDTVSPIIFNPATGAKSFPLTSPSAQGCMNISLLPDGRACMVGGQEGDQPGGFRDAVRWVKAYDSVDDSWEVLPELLNPTGRWYPGMARLADGSFLAMGGGTRPAAARIPTCERLDLSTLTWSYTGSMLNASEFTPAALLYTGEVLATWSPPQLYNPQTGAWRATGNFNQPVRGWPNHSDHSLVVLADGRAAAIGIRKGPDNNTVMGEIYDPATGAWSLTSNPALVRFQTEVVQLPDGRILSAGGETEVPAPPVPAILGIVKWSDLYDPATDAWRRMADMTWFREYHAVTVLAPDGRVVMTGGTRIKFQYGPTSADIEAFVPPNLLRGVRPRITQLSSTAPGRGDTITLDVFPQTGITSVVLMGTGAHTHWLDTGVQRRLVLPASQVGSTVSVTLPADPNLVPLGYYMLFAMVDDIPSVARILEVLPAVCRADFDGDGAVNVQDFLAYLGAFAAGDPRADFTGDGQVNVQDFLAFLSAFAQGCE